MIDLSAEHAKSMTALVDDLKQGMLKGSATIAQALEEFNSGVVAISADSASKINARALELQRGINDLEKLLHGDEEIERKPPTITTHLPGTPEHQEAIKRMDGEFIDGEAHDRADVGDHNATGSGDGDSSLR